MSIFEEVQLTPETPDNALEVLVGEGKKFKDVNDLAKAKLEADNYIRRLEAENAEMRPVIQKQLTLEEIMTQIKSNVQPPVPPVSSEPGQKPAETPLDINSQVLKVLEEQQRKDAATKNRQAVEQKLQDVWGADAQINLNRKARELGVTTQYLAQLATQSPAVFFKTIDLVDRGPSPAPTQIVPRGQVQTQPPVGNQDVRNAKYYEKLKASNPSAYFSQDVQKQYYKDAMKLGMDFYA